MADNDKASPEDANADRRTATPDQVVGDTRFLLVQETFEIAQTMGRAMERLDSQSRKIDQLDEAIRTLSEKVDRISRDFAYIKKTWWLVLILVGVALKEAYDMLIRPVIG